MELELERGKCDWCGNESPNTKRYDDGERVCWPCIAEAATPGFGVYALHKKVERGELVQ